MEKYYIERTKSTPEISYNPDECTFAIRGESYPENSFDFYKPIFAEFQKLLRNASKFKLILDLSYMNTSSTKAIVNILDLLNEAWESGRAIDIEWYYEEDNEHILELAEDFQALIDIPIKLIPIE